MINLKGVDSRHDMANALAVADFPKLRTDRLQNDSGGVLRSHEDERFVPKASHRCAEQEMRHARAAVAEKAHILKCDQGVLQF